MAADKLRRLQELAPHLRHDGLLLLPVDRDRRGVNPSGGAEVPEPDVGVLRHQGVGSTGPSGRVKLEQRGKVVGVRHRDEVVDWTVVGI